MRENQFPSNGNRNQEFEQVSAGKNGINRELNDMIVFTKAFQTVYTHLQTDRYTHTHTHTARSDKKFLRLLMKRAHRALFKERKRSIIFYKKSRHSAYSRMRNVDTVQLF